MAFPQKHSHHLFNSENYHSFSLVIKSWSMICRWKVQTQTEDRILRKSAKEIANDDDVTERGTCCFCWFHVLKEDNLIRFLWKDEENVLLWRYFPSLQQSKSFSRSETADRSHEFNVCYMNARWRPLVAAVIITPAKEEVRDKVVYLGNRAGLMVKSDNLMTFLQETAVIIFIP